MIFKVYLFEKQRKGNRKKEREPSDLQVHSLVNHKGWDCTSLRPGGRSFLQVCYLGSGIQTLEPCSIDFTGTLAESLIRYGECGTQNSAHMGRWNYRLWLIPLYHDSSLCYVLKHEQGPVDRFCNRRRTVREFYQLKQRIRQMSVLCMRILGAVARDHSYLTYLTIQLVRRKLSG